MYMTGYVGSCRLEEFSEEFQPSVMTDRELEKGNECLGNIFKNGVSSYGFIYIPFGWRSHEGSLKKLQMNEILNNYFSGTPEVERHDMIRGVLPYSSLKFGNI